MSPDLRLHSWRYVRDLHHRSCTRTQSSYLSSFPFQEIPYELYWPLHLHFPLRPGLGCGSTWRWLRRSSSRLPCSPQVFFEQSPSTCQVGLPNHHLNPQISCFSSVLRSHNAACAKKGNGGDCEHLCYCTQVRRGPAKHLPVQGASHRMSIPRCKANNSSMCSHVLVQA